MVRLTDGPDMTLDVYCGCKTTIQQQQHNTGLNLRYQYFIFVISLCEAKKVVTP